MKILSKTLLALYSLLLLWLVLLKFSTDLSAVLGYQMRSLNLIPFIDAFQGNFSEMSTNFVVFVPLGLLLGVNFKRITFGRKLAFVFFFSLIAEVTQYVLAIGTTDVTDVITNTFGGFFGLLMYKWANKYVDDGKLDRFIVVTGTVLFVLLMLLRVFVFKVRY